MRSIRATVSVSVRGSNATPSMVTGQTRAGAARTAEPARTSGAGSAAEPEAARMGAVDAMGSTDRTNGPGANGVSAPKLTGGAGESGRIGVDTYFSDGGPAAILAWPDIVGRHRPFAPATMTLLRFL